MNSWYWGELIVEGSKRCFGGSSRSNAQHSRKRKYGFSHVLIFWSQWNTSSCSSLLLSPWKSSSFLYQFINIVTGQGRDFDKVVHAELSECLVDDLVSEELLVGLGSVQVTLVHHQQLGNPPHVVPHLGEPFMPVTFAVIHKLEELTIAPLNIEKDYLRLERVVYALLEHSISTTSVPL